MSQEYDDDVVCVQGSLVEWVDSMMMMWSVLKVCWWNESRVWWWCGLCSRFVGGMSREEASRRLERHPNGTYLVRVSQSDSRRGEYALSIKWVLSCHMVITVANTLHNPVLDFVFERWFRFTLICVFLLVA